MSDFYDRKDFDKPLQICRSRHDVVGIQLYDPLLKQLPDVGLLRICDAETGHEMYIDTSSRAVRREHERYWRERMESLQHVFTKNAVDYVSVATDGDFVKALRQMFERRG